MSRRNIGWLAVLLAVPVSGMAAEIAARDGLYEITARTEMPMMPASMPPQVVRQCFTKADMQNPQRMVTDSKQDPSCQIKDVNSTASQMSFTMDCPAEGLQGRGEYHFSETGYTGKVTMTIPDPQGGTQPMAITTTTTAKLIGPCP